MAKAREVFETTLGHREAQARSAFSAMDKSPHRVIVPTLSPAVVLKRQDLLHAIEQFSSDDWLVLTRIIDTVPSHDACVERIGEGGGDSCAREWSPSRAQSAFIKVGLQCGQRPRARRVELEWLSDERSLLGMHLDPSLASFAFGSNVAIADGRLGRPPSALQVLQLSLADPLSKVS